MFVVIDGIDWSGKWTQVKLVKKELEKWWKTVKIIDYPRYWEKACYFVEKYLNWEYGKYVEPKTASLFYAVDRYDSSFELREDLEKYDYIIGNRYVSSSMIHQAGKIEDLKKLEDYLDWLYDLEYNVLALPQPEKVLFLDVAPEVSAKLLLKKEKRDYIKNSDNLDLHEADKNHLKNAYNRAVFVAEKYDDWIRIECTKDNEIKSREEITQLILSQIK